MSDHQQPDPHDHAAFYAACTTITPSAIDRTNSYIAFTLTLQPFRQRCDRIAGLQLAVNTINGRIQPSRLDAEEQSLELHYGAVRAAANECITAGTTNGRLQPELTAADDAYTTAMRQLCQLVNKLLDEWQTSGPHPRDTLQRSRSKQPTVEADTGPQPLHDTLLDEQHECDYCRAGPLMHMPYCPAFLALSPLGRRRMAVDRVFCFICLRDGHADDTCASTSGCQICGDQHNSMLHVPDEVGTGDEHGYDTDGSSAPTKPKQRPLEQQRSLTQRFAVESSFNATAIVYAYGVDTPPIALRAFIDQGSDKSLIGQRTALQLRLPQHRADVPLRGAGGVLAGHSTSTVALRLVDVHGLGHAVDVRAFVMPQMTGGTTMTAVRPKRPWPHMQGLTLADEQFLQRKRYDMMLGSDVFGQLLRPGLRQALGLPTALNTIFGWIVTGVLAEREHEGWRGDGEEAEGGA